jgi:hypothetical protein
MNYFFPKKLPVGLKKGFQKKKNIWFSVFWGVQQPFTLKLKFERLKD